MLNGRHPGARERVGRRPTLLLFVLFGGLVARAGDHDPLGLDDDLDGAVSCPVLRVDGIVRHGGVEPQPVALLAVVEGALEFAAAASPPAPATAAPAALAGLLLVLAPGLGGLLLLVVALILLLRLCLERGGHQGVVLGPEVRLLVRPDTALVAVGVARDEVVLALEAPDVRDGDIELVGYPGVRPAFA